MRSSGERPWRPTPPEYFRAETSNPRPVPQNTLAKSELRGGEGGSIPRAGNL
jgi:hypothetical protein